MATKKTKTCKRCNGTGGFESHVDMGRCWACNAAGGFVWVTAEEAATEFDAGTEEALAYYVAEGRKLAGSMERRRQLQARLGREVVDSREDVAELEALRKLWLDRATGVGRPSKGYWKAG